MSDMVGQKVKWCDFIWNFLCGGWMDGQRIGPWESSLLRNQNLDDSLYQDGSEFEDGRCI